MTTIGALLLESIAAETRRCDAGETLKFSQALACLPDRWALSEIPDAPKGPEPKPGFEVVVVVTKPVADLCAGDLGRIVEPNGYRGRLRGIEVADERGYVRLVLSERYDDTARFPVLVKPDMPVRVMPEVTA